VVVAPVAQVEDLHTVVVQSLASRLTTGVGAVVVTNTVEVEVAHPAPHVSHGLSTVFVGVSGQHGSIGGTKAVVVFCARHIIYCGHPARLGHPASRRGVATVLV